MLCNFKTRLEQKPLTTTTVDFTLMYIRTSWGRSYDHKIHLTPRAYDSASQGWVQATAISLCTEVYSDAGGLLDCLLRSTNLALSWHCSAK